MKKILLLAYFDPDGLETIRESVECWQLCERHHIEVLNLKGRAAGFEIPTNVNLARYDGVIIHNTLSYNPENLYALERLPSIQIGKFRGRKILLKQDEHLKSDIVDRAILDLGFDVVFTLTNSSLRHRFYPRALKAGVEFVPWMTGYIPERLKNIKSRAHASRPLDLIYRGSRQPESFGQLAFEKAAIAERALKGLAGQSLRLDISNRWEDRKLGTGWYDFLSSSRATLGVESGASILDPNGRLERMATRLKSILPQDYFAFLRRSAFAPWEEPGIYSAIAPRHFEAIATRTVQVMYGGDFSGLLEAGKHYISVPRLDTDWNDVADSLRDYTKLKQIADFAYNDIVASGRLSYASFIRSAEQTL